MVFISFQGLIMKYINKIVLVGLVLIVPEYGISTPKIPASTAR